MSPTAELSADAGLLVRMSLNARSGPLSEDHAALVGRFLAEPALRGATEATIDGLGLRLVNASQEGGLLLTSAGADSPFRMRLADYFPRQTTGVQRRMLLACAMVASFVAFFPRPEDLEDTNERLRRRDVDDVDRLVRDVSARLDAEARERGEELDPPIDEPDLARAWTVWRQTSNSKKGADGREREVGTRQVVVRCLDLLAEQGLLRTIVKGETYASTRRMQAMARELVGSLAWSQVAPSHPETPEHADAAAEAAVARASAGDGSAEASA
ncbi:hypothetical protein Q5424_17710 [Conexibacter sp. JD483]|uniref:hypothetical protein n=1 Tax=unclassified Conexibacter TaxID=2627773 RepID=UPI0027276329|nr:MULTISPECIES: hypothetical protein [unclassified Conexibacter]MDO8188722.1 hypothetical protein [Conexibacter sp. CPCC 205706]MDO8201249.1 hypothetical protein [Conexibacter sp. CPCC 205762]MDR9370937.1 hypothetical protein [Conexibacter sp. JD483]